MKTTLKWGMRLAKIVFYLIAGAIILIALFGKPVKADQNAIQQQFGCDFVKAVEDTGYTACVVYNTKTRNFAGIIHIDEKSEIIIIVNNTTGTEVWADVHNLQVSADKLKFTKVEGYQSPNYTMVSIDVQRGVAGIGDVKINIWLPNPDRSDLPVLVDQ